MQQNNLKKVVVFIPALNEEGCLARAIDEVREIYPLKKTSAEGYEVDILVVNDGSQDRTQEIAEEKGVHVISHPVNMGLGAATRTALRYSNDHDAEVAVKLDADLQHDPKDIEKVIKPVLDNKADICWGSRFAGKITYKMPIIRRMGNRFFTWLMNKFTNYKISDAQTGLMAYGRNYLNVFFIPANYNPPQQILIDANYKHMRYVEVPVVFNSRTTGKSFISLKYPFYVIPNIFRVIFFASPFKVFGSIGALFMLIAVAVIVSWLVDFFYSLGYYESFPDVTSLILFIGGLNTFFYGMLAELIIKTRK